MKTKPLMLAIALIAVFGLTFLLWQGDGDSRHDTPASGAPASESERRSEPLDLEAAAVETNADAGETSELGVARSASLAPLAPAATDTTSAAAPRALVIGRVVGLDDEPLAGVRVELRGGNPWRVGNSEAQAFEDSQNWTGFHCATDGQGRFELDVPLPDKASTKLIVEPDPHHERFDGYFSDGKGRWPALVEGTRDVGKITLVTCGVVRGTVHAVGGAALAGAKVHVASGLSYTIGGDTLSLADGSYEVRHVPPGSWGVGAMAHGYLSEFVSPLEVLGGDDLRGPDFVLDFGSTIRGRVVDQAGLGIAEARVTGWPMVGGKGSFATTGGDGGFELSLSAECKYRVSAEAQGYRDLSGTHGGVEMAPGTDDAMLQLESKPRTTIVVLDASSGQPIELFGLELYSGGGSEGSGAGYGANSREPVPKVHPLGRAEGVAAPGVDSIRIAAPGYCSQSIDVRWDDGTSGTQTLRLERGSSVRGQLVGSGTAGVRLSLQQGWPRSKKPVISFNGIAPEIEALPVGVEEPFESWPSTPPVQADASADGEFEFSGLGSGNYRLFGNLGADGFAIELVYELGKGEQRDLGRIEPRAAGRIDGRVLTGEGVDPAGLEIVLDGGKPDRSTRSNSKGEFSFEGIEPGPHQLQSGGRKGDLAASEPSWVQLEAGGQTEVELDLRGRRTVRVGVRVTRGGQPLVDQWVSLDVEDRPFAGSFTVYTTDSNGHVSIDVLPGAAAVVKLDVDGRTLAPAVGRVQLIAGFDLELEIELPNGSVELPLPAGVDPDGRWSHRLELFEGEALSGVPVCEIRSRLAAGKLQVETVGIELLQDPPRLLVGGLPLGRHALRWTAQALLDPGANGSDSKSVVNSTDPPLVHESMVEIR